MKQCFVEKKFKPDNLALIYKINRIIEEYQEQGYELTLRQVYYQLVARGFIPNNERSYKNVGNLISEARLAGLIDWNAIVDRTRHLRKNTHWNSPKDILQAAANQYEIDKRATQGIYIEVWVEKDALISIVEDVCSKLDVPCFSCRGYVSQSEMYEAARRIKNQLNNEGKYEAFIIHLGDHDPSGIDMTRDIQERMDLFGADVRVDRIALTWEQIELYNPPTNPTKLTDSRATGYIEKYGYDCWELDALEPRVIEQLIIDSVTNLTDIDLYEDAKEKEQKEKDKLYEFIKELEEDEE